MQLDNVNVAVERCKPIYIYLATHRPSRPKRYPCFLHRVRLTLSIPSLIGAYTYVFTLDSLLHGRRFLGKCQWNGPIPLQILQQTHRVEMTQCMVLGQTRATFYAWNPSRALKRRNVARPNICHTSDASCPCHGHDGLQSMDSWLPLAYRSQCCNRVCSVD